MVDDLATLEVRVSRGFDFLHREECAGRSGHFYPQYGKSWQVLFDEWRALLEDYEYRLAYLKITRAV